MVSSPRWGFFFGPDAVYCASSMPIAGARNQTQTPSKHPADCRLDRDSLTPTRNRRRAILAIILTVWLPLLLDGCNMQNSQGEYRSLDGSEYVGQFRDGQPNGQGTLTYADGSMYIGDLRDGKPDGHGTFTRYDGWRCVGEFHEGKVNGRGTLTFLNREGEEYVGEFKNGEVNGQGTFQWPDGCRYVGEFREGKMDGRGEMIHPDGTVERGLWRDDAFVGPETSS